MQIFNAFKVRYGQHKAEILSARIDMLYSHLPLASFAMMAGISYIYLYFDLSECKNLLRYWYLISICVALIIIAIYCFYQHNRNLVLPSTWMRVRFVLGVTVGLNLSLSNLFLFYDGSPENLAIIVTFINCSMGIALLTSAANPITFIVFTSIILLPLCAYLIQEGKYNLVLFELIVALMAIGLCYKSRKGLMDALYFQFENVSLLKQLEVQKRLAEEANSAKSRLLAGASHDLRQPVHALRLFLDAINPKSAVDNSEVLDFIRASVININDLFNELLDITKLDKGMIEVQARRFDISELLNKLGEEFSPLASRKKLRFELNSQTAFLYTDPVLLERILRNLLSNAIKYTSSGSIQVKQCVIEGSVEIVVADSGIGIGRSEQACVFTEFYQGENLNESSGLGLGLAIVRRLVDLLKYDIQLKSEEGVGSTFVLRIPVDECLITKVHEELKPSQVDLTGKLIWVIDDDASILKAMSLLLSRHGAEVHTSASLNIDEEIESLGENISPNSSAKIKRPDLILSDFHLGHGYAQKKDFDRLKTFWRALPPVIVVTGDLSLSIEAAKNHGLPIKEIIYKPVAADRLMAAIKKQLDKKDGEESMTRNSYVSVNC